MNGARADAGVAPLAVDGAIGWVPRDWSNHMAQNQNLAHNPNYSSQIRSSRPEATRTAENVGYASNGARTVFDGFMNSPGHRANILRGEHTHVATGCSIDSRGYVWVSVDFWG